MNNDSTAIWGLLVLCFAVCFGHAAGCDPYPKDRTVLEWHDTARPLQITVVERFLAADIVYEMRVVDKGNDRVVVLGDKMVPKAMSIVEYREWLLVLKGDYVIGGYSTLTGQIGGIAESAIFPFTVRVGGGKLLDTVDLESAAG